MWSRKRADCRPSRFDFRPLQLPHAANTRRHGHHNPGLHPHARAPSIFSAQSRVARHPRPCEPRHRYQGIQHSADTHSRATGGRRYQRYPQHSAGCSHPSGVLPDGESSLLYGRSGDCACWRRSWRRGRSQRSHHTAEYPHAYCGTPPPDSAKNPQIFASLQAPRAWRVLQKLKKKVFVRMLVRATS